MRVALLEQLLQLSAVNQFEPHILGPFSRSRGEARSGNYHHFYNIQPSGHYSVELSNCLFSHQVSVAVTLALESGFSKGHLSEILRGMGSPSVKTLFKLAEALDVEVCDFFVFPETMAV
jgi:hypothetical protein